MCLPVQYWMGILTSVAIFFSPSAITICHSFSGKFSSKITSLTDVALCKHKHTPLQIWTLINSSGEKYKNRENILYVFSDSCLQIRISWVNVWYFCSAAVEEFFFTQLPIIFVLKTSLPSCSRGRGLLSRSFLFVWNQSLVIFSLPVSWVERGKITNSEFVFMLLRFFSPAFSG